MNILKKLGIVAIVLAVAWWGSRTPSEANLKEMLAESVVFVVRADRQTGGTGFVLNNNKGRQYIITNAHVCEVAKDENNQVTVITNDRIIKRSIVEISTTTDLCLVENSPGSATGLNMASDWGWGQKVYTMGHPYLFDSVFSSGYVVQERTVSILAFQIESEEDEARCNKSNQSIKDLQWLFGTVKVCVNEYNSIQTNVEIFPGNSGSPLTNAWGEVVGVIFAGSSDNHWGNAIPLNELKEFINKY